MVIIPKSTNLLLFILIIIICWSWVFVGHSQGEGEGGDSMKCVKKLLTCEAYLKGSSVAPPSPLCCVPLIKMIRSDAQCLCAVFNSPTILKSLNVTQDDALNLAKSCRANANTSICKNASAPSTPTAPSINSSATSPPPHKKNAAPTSISHSHVGDFVSLAPIFSFIVFAF